MSEANSNCFNLLDSSGSLGMGSVLMPLVVLNLANPGIEDAGDMMLLIMAIAMNIGIVIPVPGLLVALTAGGNDGDPDTDADNRLN